MSTTRRARLLPWPTLDGKPCYLVTDGGGRLSRLADDMEALQLGMADALLDHAAYLLAADRKARAGELHYLACRLSESLRDAVRVAESRGDRLEEFLDGT